jgi:hypothetical protein
MIEMRGLTAASVITHNDLEQIVEIDLDGDGVMDASFELYGSNGILGQTRSTDGTTATLQIDRSLASDASNSIEGTSGNNIDGWTGLTPSKVSASAAP